METMSQGSSKHLNGEERGGEVVILELIFILSDVKTDITSEKRHGENIFVIKVIIKISEEATNCKTKTQLFSPHTTASSNKKEKIKENIRPSTGHYRERPKDGMFSESVETALQTLQSCQGDGLLVVLHQ